MGKKKLRSWAALTDKERREGVLWLEEQAEELLPDRRLICEHRGVDLYEIVMALVAIAAHDQAKGRGGEK